MLKFARDKLLFLSIDNGLFYHLIYDLKRQMPLQLKSLLSNPCAASLDMHSVSSILVLLEFLFQGINISRTPIERLPRSIRSGLRTLLI